MATQLFKSTPFVSLLAAGLLSFSFISFAETSNPFSSDVGELQVARVIDDEKRPHPPLVLPYKEPKNSSWALAVDNDIFALGGRDQDYTYGLNLTYSGSAAQEAWISLDKPLATVDRLLGLDKLSSHGINNHSIEVGLFGFTPEDIEIAEANQEDRPYASLVYVSSSREQVDLANQVAWKTTLTLGALGLNLVGEFQNQVHDQLDGNQSLGWDNQISDGGELTARYAIARQQYLGTVFGNTELKSTLQASVGYLTEASWSLSIRGGKYHTPWSSFNPELASYGEKSTYTTSSSKVREHYFWGGVALKARAYNAFLQGQFRDSAVTYNHSELNPVVVEAWLGYTIAFAEGYRVSYVLRGHSSEIKEGAGDRNLVWGGLILAKTLR
jgi:hypothetical protein